MAVARVDSEALLGGERLAPEEDGAFRELACEVRLAGVHLAPKLVLPGRDAVGPRGDRELPAPGAVDGEPTAAAIVSERPERHLAPTAARRGRGRGPSPPSVSCPSLKTVA